MQQTAVTVGVSNDNYAEITSGLNEGDTVYVEKKTTTDSSSGLNSILSIFGGGGDMPSAPSGGSFDPGSFGGGSFDPSSFGGGGNFGGGNGGGSRGGSGGNRP